MPGGRLYAQQYYFKHYSIEDGLAQSQVMSIYQDNNHYLWFGTQSGVSRFNGTDFVNYAKIDGIHGNMVSSIFQDNDRILLRTGIGISSFENNHVTDFFLAAGYAWDSHLLKTRDNKLWLIGRTRLYMLVGNKLKRVVIGKDDEKVKAITLNKEGDIYAAVAGEGVFCLTKDKWIKKVDFDSTYKKIDVSKIQFDRFDKSKLWMLTLDKLYQVVNGVIQPFQNPLLNKYKGLLMDIAQDKDGAIWLGGDNGALYLNRDNSIRFTHANGFTNRAVTAIYCDKEDIIWLATDGDGFYKFQGLNVVSYQKIDDTPLPIIGGLAQDKLNNVWGSTSDMGLIKIKNNHLSNVLLPDTNPLSRTVICLNYKEQQPLLIGTAAGLWQLDGDKFSRVDKLFVQYINKVYCDDSNRIWVGTNTGVYYAEKGHFKQVEGSKRGVVTFCSAGKDSIFTGEYGGIDLIVKGKLDASFQLKQLKNVTILSILKVNHLLLIATFGEGIYLADIVNHRLKNISSLDGLKSNDVYSLIASDKNTIWAGTGKGINKFRIDEANLSVSLINDIIPNPTAEYNQNAILKFDNKIWLSNGLGIFAYNISNDAGIHRPVINIEGVNLISQSNTKADNLVISANNPLNGFKFRYSNSRIVILFKGIYFTDPENLLYQYRLTGLEDQFSVPTRSNKVDYTSLKPGKYQFQVRAISAGGIKSAVKCITIEIIPVFYQTTWFYLLMFILLIGLIVLIQQYIIYYKKQQNALLEKLKREEQIKIREQTAEDFHDDIGNKLTRIAILADVLKNKTLSENGDQQKLIDQIKENATALYTDTKDILWALDPQSENLFEILSFIKNLAVDIFSNTGIALEFNMFDFKDNKFELPLDFSRNISMIFRELLHNILKHAEPSKVIINCFVQDQKITIELKDDGKGFDTEFVNHGKGLNNIRARAQRINGEIQVFSVIGAGTNVKLIFNMNG